jgi:predicted deacylase
MGGGLMHQAWFAREEQLYEARRARLVARMGLSSDQWLDVHSTSSPCTAYALPTGNPQSEELAERLDIGTAQQNLMG